MKLTTLNYKSDDYTENHEIIVGTHIGSLKRLDVSQENPYLQENLQDISSLKKDSVIHALNFNDSEKNKILIGRANNIVELYDLKSKKLIDSYEFSGSPIVGICRHDNEIIAGIQEGSLQFKDNFYSKKQNQKGNKLKQINVGSNVSRMRQCKSDSKLIATGGKGRENNLKITDIEKKEKVFSSKNLPNDYLQLEVPIWDSDFSFLSQHDIITCSRYGYIRLYDIRAQRRPVKMYSNETFNFSCMTSYNHDVYLGTIKGELKCFDTRYLKTFKHTYKGCTGSVSDINLDDSGKFLISASLDRYVRIHNTSNCVLLYQNYVKTKAMRVLIKNFEKNGCKNEGNITDVTSHLKADEEQSEDEYNQMFKNMDTVMGMNENSESNKKYKDLKRNCLTQINEKFNPNKKKKN